MDSLFLNLELPVLCSVRLVPIKPLYNISQLIAAYGGEGLAVATVV